jgi:hypothetical protein
MVRELTHGGLNGLACGHSFLREQNNRNAQVARSRPRSQIRAHCGGAAWRGRYLLGENIGVSLLGKTSFLFLRSTFSCFLFAWVLFKQACTVSTDLYLFHLPNGKLMAFQATQEMAPKFALQFHQAISSPFEMAFLFHTHSKCLDICTG